MAHRRCRGTGEGVLPDVKRRQCYRQRRQPPVYELLEVCLLSRERSHTPPACETRRTYTACVLQGGVSGYARSPPTQRYIRHITPAINEGCTRSLRISHTSRRAPLQPAPKTQVPCTPCHPPNIAGVVEWCVLDREGVGCHLQPQRVDGVGGGARVQAHGLQAVSELQHRATPRHERSARWFAW